MIYFVRSVILICKVLHLSGLVKEIRTNSVSIQKLLFRRETRASSIEIAGPFFYQNKNKVKNKIYNYAKIK